MGQPIHENDEFLLSRLLDGDLPPDEADGLRRRLASEPALREALASLERVDALVKRRHADQPDVDWGRLHERVMDAVGVRPVGAAPVIRLTRWIRIGAPLAAAAAIVLLVSLYPSSPERTGPLPDSGPGPVADRMPLGDDAGLMIVRFKRPDAPGPGEAGPIQVSFKRSDHLAEAIQREDEATKRRSWSVIAGAAEPTIPDAALRDFIEGPPL